MDVYSGFLRACTDLRRVVILPALEESPGSEVPNAEASWREKDHIQSALQVVTGGKVNVEKLWAQRKLRTFAADVYPRGHRPTDTEHWISSVSTYEVQYQLDYEPFFLCSRRLVPWYDERFTGYGKNKIVHVFHTAVLDFRFWVHPEWFVVHVHHPPSAAWQATLGRDPLASDRLSNIKLLYAIAKHGIISLPTHSGVHRSLISCACTIPNRTVHGNSWCSWQKGQGKNRKEEPMGHWSYEDQPSQMLLETSANKYVEALYELRFHFCAPKFLPVVGVWPLYSKLPRNPRDISLITVATPDRLQRLSAQCRQWKGVICAAVYAPPDIDVGNLAKQLLLLHLEVEKAGMCRLDLILMDSMKAAKRGHRFRRRAMSSNNLCPINVLRNAALGLATTDLVLLLDVDLLPASSLNDCFLNEQQYKCLWRMAVEERIAVVVPTFEFVVTPADGLIEDGTLEDHLPANLVKWSNSGLDMTEASMFEEEEHISKVEEIAAKGVPAICKGLAAGDIRGFHVKHYPAGHSPTDFEEWREISGISTEQERQCCDVCRSYSIAFSEGFEPFAICSRKLIPSFDERFRGYGYDKVTFFQHLHMSGFGFRVLLHCFALDIPHPKSQDWMETFGPGSDPLQHIRVKALYQRAKREIQLFTGRSALANQVADELPVHLMRSAEPPARFPPNSSNHLHITYIRGERKNRLCLDGLQLAWQGVIHRHKSHHKSCLKSSQEEEELPCTPCHEEEISTSGSSEISELSQRDGAVKKISGCFGWNSFGAHKEVYEQTESKPVQSVTRLEEFEWDSAGWKLKCSTDSLSNCSVVKAPRKLLISRKELFQTGRYWLRISMSAGSWSPQASRLAGITTGGISVRSKLLIRAVKTVVLRYTVRFPSSFEWVKGGTLPGLWIKDVMQANFGWRRSGEGHLSKNLTGLSQSLSEEPTGSSTERPFYFVPEQWHALQLVVSVVHQRGASEDTDNAESKTQKDRQGSVSHHPLGFESIRKDAVIVFEAFVDLELVSTVRFPSQGRSPARNGGSQGTAMGLLLTCFFGGKTQDWATAEDTHIDFSQFEIWTD